MGIDDILSDLDRAGYKFAEIVFFDFKEKDYSPQHNIMNSNAPVSSGHALSLSRIVNGIPITLTPEQAAINLYPPTEQGRCFKNYHFKLDLKKQRAVICNSKSNGGALSTELIEWYGSLDKEAELICQIFLRNGWNVKNLPKKYLNELVKRPYPPDWAKPAED